MVSYPRCKEGLAFVAILGELRHLVVTASNTTPLAEIGRALLRLRHHLLCIQGCLSDSVIDSSWGKDSIDASPNRETPPLKRRCATLTHFMTEQTRTTQDVTAFLPAELLPCAASENLDLFEMERSLLIDSSPKNQKCDPSFAMKHTSDISIRRHVLSECVYTRGDGSMGRDRSFILR